MQFRVSEFHSIFGSVLSIPKAEIHQCFNSTSNNTKRMHQNKAMQKKPNHISLSEFDENEECNRNVIKTFTHFHTLCILYIRIFNFFLHFSFVLYDLPIWLHTHEPKGINLVDLCDPVAFPLVPASKETHTVGLAWPRTFHLN